MHSQILISFFAYFCILLAIGILAHRKQTSDLDFILGNRSLNFWLTALSAHASDMSAWLFMAFPAAVFIGGLSKSWIAVGLIGGMWCNWQFVAKKLRIATEKYGSYTMPTFFEKRFNDTSGVIRVLTAVISVFFLVCYLASGLIGMGHLFNAVFGIDYYVGLSIATLVVVAYTYVGGFVTVAWTDLFQALFLLAVIVIVPVVAFFTLPDGFNTIYQAAEAKNIYLGFWRDTSWESVVTILFLASWGLGYFGQPHIVTKFMGIKSAHDMNKSKYVGMTWQVIALSAAATLGVVAIGFFPGEIDNSQLVFVDMVKILFPPLLAGFVLCAFVAANMSTMDSMILVSASVLSEDFYKRLFRKNATPKELLRISRISVIIIAVISLSLAFNQNKTVMEAVHYAWSGLGCSFGPLVLMALYSRTANRYGAIAGILVGSSIAAGWEFFNSYVPAEIPGFGLSLLSIYVVSKMTRSTTCESC